MHVNIEVVAHEVVENGEFQGYTPGISINGRVVAIGWGNHKDELPPPLPDREYVEECALTYLTDGLVWLFAGGRWHTHSDDSEVM